MILVRDKLGNYRIKGTIETSLVMTNLVKPSSNPGKNKNYPNTLFRTEL